MAKPTKPDARVESVVNLSKRRGFVYPCSEIYGGTRSAWDYGPLGVELKENIRRAWWQSVVRGRDDVVGLDSSVILAPQVWEASGHVNAFVDPLTECKQCHKRWRSDTLLEAFEEKHGRPATGLEEIVCTACGTRGQFTEPRDFNGMLRTTVGPVEEAGALLYLRPETAQGIFVNFENVPTPSREAALRHRADGQELPQRDHAGQLHLPHARVRADGDGVLLQARHGRGVARVLVKAALGLVHDLGLTPENLRLREHAAGRARRTTPSGRVDVEYRFPFAARSASSRASPTAPTSTCAAHRRSPAMDLSFFDQESDEHYVPFVIEPAAGARPRCVWRSCVDAYDEEEVPDAKGEATAHGAPLHPRLAPIKVAVLPLSRNGRPARPARGTSRRAPPHLDTSTSTTPAPSAGATAARTRSARRSA